MASDKSLRRPKPTDKRIEPHQSGSIEQHLDMCEEGHLRGDDILHSHGLSHTDSDAAMEDLVQMMTNYRMDLSETDREGDELSGDDHSSGLQGEESELRTQAHIESGAPGDEYLKDDIRERAKSHRS